MGLNVRVRSVSQGLKVGEGLVFSKFSLPRYMKITNCFHLPLEITGLLGPDQPLNPPSLPQPTGLQPCSSAVSPTEEFQVLCPVGIIIINGSHILLGT